LERERYQTCDLRGNAFFCQLTPAAQKDFEAVGLRPPIERARFCFSTNRIPRKFCPGRGEGETLHQFERRKNANHENCQAWRSPRLDGNDVRQPLRGNRRDDQCQVVFVRRDDARRFVGKHPEMSQAVIRHVGKLYSGASDQRKTVGLSASAREKLGRLLLSWSAEGKRQNKISPTQVGSAHKSRRWLWSQWPNDVGVCAGGLGGNQEVGESS